MRMTTDERSQQAELHAMRLEDEAARQSHIFGSGSNLLAASLQAGAAALRQSAGTCATCQWWTDDLCAGVGGCKNAKSPIGTLDESDKHEFGCIFHSAAPSPASRE